MGKQNLIYYVLGCDNNYIQLPKFSMYTLFLHSNMTNIDILVLCDSEYSSIVNKHLPFVKLYVTDKNETPVHTSMRKLEIFKFQDINNYNKILYLDADTVILNDISKLFEEELEDDILYVKAESNNVDKFNELSFGLKQYSQQDMDIFKQNNSKPFNAGHFLFKNTNIQKTYFNDILDYISKYNGPFFYEQSFLNHYFQKNNKYNHTLLDKHISFYDGIWNTEIKNNVTIVHCFKSDLPYIKKLEHMKKILYEKNSTLPITQTDSRDLLSEKVKLPEKCKIAEIGVFLGDFSERLLNMYSPYMLYLIDSWDGNITSGDKNGNNIMTYTSTNVYSHVLNKFKDAKNVTIIKHLSTIINSFSDNSFDMCYIDADHGYEGCLADLQSAYNKVKHNGWICGHDIAINKEKTKNIFHFGVAKAVSEFCFHKGLKIQHVFMDGCVSYAIQVKKYDIY